jgi:hypothetical protein
MTESTSSATPESRTEEQQAILNAVNNPPKPGGADPKPEPPIPGLEFIGLGYDVFGRYANVDSCKGPVLDLSAVPVVPQQVMDNTIPPEQLAGIFAVNLPFQLKLNSSRPEKVLFYSVFRMDYDSDFASKVEDQVTKWSTHANITGGYGLFSGEVDARFGSKLSKLATTSFYSLVTKAAYWQLSLDYTESNPPPLRQNVQNMLDDENVTPAKFFDEFGTHYVAKARIGTRVTISCAIDTSNISSKIKLETYFKANYGGEKANIGASGDATYQNAVKKIQEHTHINKSGEGISDEQLANIKDKDTSVLALKGGWKNPTLIDFPPNDALVPMWRHCKIEARRKKFEEVFKDLSARKAAAAGFSLYTPIYLYRQDGEENCPNYRLSRRGDLEGPQEAGVAWKIEN